MRRSVELPVKARRSLLRFGFKRIEASLGNEGNDWWVSSKLAMLSLKVALEKHDEIKIS